MLHVTVAQNNKQILTSSPKLKVFFLLKKQTRVCIFHLKKTIVYVSFTLI